MPNYLRYRVDGGVYFFTLVVHERREIFKTESHRVMLRLAILEVRRHRPFHIDGIVLLPEHLHMLMRLPEGDHDYSRRISGMKRNFTEAYLAAGGTEGHPTASRRRQRYRGVWQKRFYEHTIRDFRDFRRHLDYIHINPVKHGLVAMPWDWPWSSFRRYVRLGVYEWDWCGQVDTGGIDIPPEFW